MLYNTYRSKKNSLVGHMLYVIAVILCCADDIIACARRGLRKPEVVAVWPEGIAAVMRNVGECVVP